MKNKNIKKSNIKRVNIPNIPNINKNKLILKKY